MFQRSSVCTIVLLLTLTLLSLTSISQAAKLDTPIRFAIIGDRTGEHQPGIYGQIVTEVERLRPDFVMTVGDQIEGYVDDSVQIMAELDEYDSLVSQLSMPIYLTPGNHDIWSDASERWFIQRRSAPYYSFDRQGVHIVVLDMSRWDDGRQLPQEQLDWLRRDLAGSRDAAYTLAFFHKPFWYETVAVGIADPVHNLFLEYGVDAAFCGHYHEWFAAELDGIKYIAVGSSGGGAGSSASGLDFHYAWVTIDSDGVHVAPVEINSVKPWDLALPEDKRAFDRLLHLGLQLDQPLLVEPGVTLEQASFNLVVDNSNCASAVNDTLRWETPSGWQIEPAALPVNVASGASESFPFTVSCSGEFFPPPSASLNFNFKEGIVAPASASLELCRQTSCYAAAAAPNIDGDLTDACWQQPATGLLTGEGSENPSEPVEFFFAYDADNLYLAARCVDSRIDSVVASATAHDGAVWSNDCVGYFLSPTGRSGPAYQIYFNPNAVSFDQKLTLGQDGWMDTDLGWDGEYEAEAVNNANGWTVEARVPLAQLAAEAKNGDQWRVNFRRKQPRVGNSDWQTPIDYNPRSFGVLLFR
ncbi:MAG: metallophosphoesterase [bacterium]